MAPGDPRGFRTRHHREHVEGDYRNPPAPGVHDETFEKSKELMQDAGREPVVLSREAREVASRVMRESLEFKRCEVGALHIAATHYHIVARFAGCSPRAVVGVAKKRVAQSDLKQALTNQLSDMRAHNSETVSIVGIKMNRSPNAGFRNSDFFGCHPNPRGGPHGFAILHCI